MIRLELATGTEVIDLNSVLDPSSATVGEVTRTNLVTNPSFNAGLTGWDWNSVFDAYVQPDAMQRVSEGDGTYAARIDFADNTSKASTFYYSAIGLTEGQAHTISMDVWMSDNAQPVVLDAVFVKTSPPLDAAQGKGKWTRLSLTFTPTAAVTFVGIRSTVGNASGDSGWIKVKNVLLEQTPEVRPYFDGSTVAEEAYTYQWTGEAHASTSIQREHVVGPGVQALVGATGFGLPPVVSQYDEGAGDGATFRSQRFGPRVIDLPIYVDGRDRTGLIDQVSKVVNLLRKGCELRVYDDEHWEDNYWYLNVHLEGGFEFTYGEDTTGERDLLTVLTLKAGDPVWRFSESLSQDDKGEVVDFVFDEIGDYDSAPVVTINGPTLGARITVGEGSIPGENASRGELSFSGLLAGNEQIVVDFESGTAVNEEGSGRWHLIAPDSRLLKVPAPEGWVRVELDNSSDEYIEQAGMPLINHLDQPNWYMPQNPAWVFTKSSGSNWSSNYALFFLNGNASVAAGEWAKRSYTVTGLTPGRPYTFVGSLEDEWPGRPRPTSPPLIYLDLDEGGLYASSQLVYDTGTSRVHDYFAEFIALDSGSVTIEYITPWGHFPASTTNSYYMVMPREFPGMGTGAWAMGAVLEGTGHRFDSAFTGNTPANDKYEYSWLGTPHESKSQRIPIIGGPVTGGPELTGAQVEVTPRRLVVI